LKHCLRLAVEWGYLEKHPLIGIKLFNVDNKVENYLNDDELESLLTVLRTHPNRPVCGIALYLLSTGCRLNEALRATWDQIDLGRRLWSIPATNSKSKKLRTVPLNDTALEVLLGFEDRTGNANIPIRLHALLRGNAKRLQGKNFLTGKPRQPCNTRASYPT